jgi:hypothetical protein
MVEKKRHVDKRWCYLGVEYRSKRDGERERNERKRMKAKVKIYERKQTNQPHITMKEKYLL